MTLKNPLALLRRPFPTKRKMWRTDLSVIVVLVACLQLTLGLSSLSAETSSNSQGHRRHHLHHGPKRRGREITLPSYQSYVADRRPENFIPLQNANDASAMHQNLHKPDFVNCADYRPSIPEGQPLGTSVIQVQALDRDPPETGGTITYSIVSGNEMNAAFSIDENSGWITTKKMFDRDEPAKEKEIYVTVQASDNGNPRLESVCTLKVQITDINDNTAQFLLSRRFNQGTYVPEHQWNPTLDKYEYKESMPQDLGVGEVVMRISATDIDDGNNGTVVYRIEPHPQNPGDFEFFDIDRTTGEIKLKKRIGHQTQFQLRIVASDLGSPPLSAMTDLSIVVAEPSERPPEFISPVTHVTIDEAIYNLSIPVATFSARSNADDDLVFFELVNGQTQPTNKEAIFTLETEGKNTAHVKLDRQLDYESNSKYTLTIRAQNKHNLASEAILTVIVTDQNDEKPYFTEVTTGSVLENEQFGTTVMRVRAIDTDGTSPNNEVSYYLKRSEEDFFSIDEHTGEIRTKKVFDREEKDTYQVTIYAKDGAPSVILKNGQPNERPQTLKIVIADKNDNPPAFVKSYYEAEMSEDADVNRQVVEVKAKDPDTASILRYSIVDGNYGDAFAIKSTTTSGVITVNKKLDYETTREYELTIRVSDSVHEAMTKVKILIQNVNDENPKFVDMETKKTILEESIPAECIFVVKAYDPDIADRNAPQNISYFMYTAADHFTVGEEDGCVRVKKELDREDKPLVQLFVGAYDEKGQTPTKLAGYVDLTVNLIDINDNAPVLSSPNPVVWNENQPRGPITQLDATDADSAENGPPFSFAIDPKADPKIKELFSIDGKTLKANKDNFDREEIKQYVVPIAITDSGARNRMTGTSYLTVIIGDENDNDMKDGESKIFVYKYKEKNPFPIGRVYVEDPDDWDLPDKTFTLTTPNSHFTVDSDTGYINMYPTADAGTHSLTFRVTDAKWGSTVSAKVTVTVKEITDDAVDNSGSIRFMGTSKEQFIKPDKTGLSKKDRLKKELAKIFNVPEDNVDVFTVGNSPSNPDMNYFDVRYSVHNSPYWKAEKLNGKLAESKELLERSLELNIVMIGIDECLKEKHFCESSCSNHLSKSDIPLKIFTNTTSFVGVHAFVEPKCQCTTFTPPQDCLPNPCLNNGICRSGGGIDGFKCECDEGFDGPRCEITSISLSDGFAWFEPLKVCNDSVLEIQFATGSPNALIFYNGPIYQSSVTDFISLELQNGHPLLLMDYGSGTSKIDLIYSSNLADGNPHKIYLTWHPTMITMRVDECRANDKSCYRVVRPEGPNTQLNVNGPLQLGGISFNPEKLQNAMKWNIVPGRSPFQGCIANLTFNGMYYNLGEPSHSTVNVTKCDSPVAGVIKASLGVDYSFIIILLVCIAILFILVVAILVYRRRRSYEEVKAELGDDVRENIINYSDEGGGEGDQTGYDLSVLMKPANGVAYITSPHDKMQMHPLGRAPQDDGPDLSSFLQDNKAKVDTDPDGLPFDDVRNYAYEGDGNSMGSLSSLASGTEDGDLNFDYLPTFGPRFKKLADMYGGQSSDDESYVGRPPPEAWC